MAGTIMKTSSRVNHTVKEMPSRIHSKLSKGLKKSSIFEVRWAMQFTQNYRAEQLSEEVLVLTSWPQVAFLVLSEKGRHRDTSRTEILLALN